MVMAQFAGKRVFVRGDLNLPVINGRVQPHARLTACARTTRALSDAGAKTILMAHQGQKGEPDFISLKGHAPLLEEACGKPVKFIDYADMDKVRALLTAMKNGDIILLENVRFLDDETAKYSSHSDFANFTLISKLGDLCDAFMLDALSVAHREHASVVGFSYTGKPTYMGPVLAREYAVIMGMRGGTLKQPVYFLLGGGKVRDSIAIIDKYRDKAALFMLGGLLANCVLAAKGAKIALPKAEPVGSLATAKNILLPMDLAYEENGIRKECDVERADGRAYFDIGSDTVGSFIEALAEANTIIINGPLGAYENPLFAKGSIEVLRAIVASPVRCIFGGGDTNEVLEQNGIQLKDGDFASLSGKAFLMAITGERLAGLELPFKNSPK
ncbi:phosphoglycerate kinase [Candidatus Micrarchaeota archaeon CG1_02_49_24]|nr:MAG: phosphoglycerate kinase [Candidatus Micrarchaeota archaeon CG1_02_49_24]HII54391.1 phosphoglycerate kinase [Candidatus Micrarchaeota archaeon]